MLYNLTEITTKLNYLIGALLLLSKSFNSDSLLLEQWSTKVCLCYYNDMPGFVERAEAKCLSLSA